MSHVLKKCHNFESLTERMEYNFCRMWVHYFPTQTYGNSGRGVGTPALEGTIRQFQVHICSTLSSYLGLLWWSRCSVFLNRKVAGDVEVLGVGLTPSWCQIFFMFFVAQWGNTRSFHMICFLALWMLERELLEFRDYSHYGGSSTRP
jgi:hypothetical protein